MTYLERIESNPQVVLGKLVIKGTRITVESLLRKISDGYTFDEILDMYPHITKEDISAAVGYALAALEGEEILKSA